MSCHVAFLWPVNCARHAYKDIIAVPSVGGAGTKSVVVIPWEGRCGNWLKEISLVVWWPLELLTYIRDSTQKSQCCWGFGTKSSSLADTIFWIGSDFLFACWWYAIVLIHFVPKKGHNFWRSSWGIAAGCQSFVRLYIKWYDTFLKGMTYKAQHSVVKGWIGSWWTLATILRSQYGMAAV